MAAIVNSVEIEQPPEKVFAYLDAVERHGEWQDQLVSTRRETDGPTGVGTRVVETRRVGGREQTMSYEITEHDPPRVFAFHGLDGPVRPVGRGVIEPVGDGSRSLMTLTLDFEGHGVGKFMLPLVRSQARKQVVKDGERMKALLESSPPETAV
jgi:uncharacterized protein YndB with AHSA1/START domain